MAAATAPPGDLLLLGTAPPGDLLLLGAAPPGELLLLGTAPPEDLLLLGTAPPRGLLLLGSYSSWGATPPWAIPPGACSSWESTPPEGLPQAGVYMMRHRSLSLLRPFSQLPPNFCSFSLTFPGPQDPQPLQTQTCHGGDPVSEGAWNPEGDEVRGES